MNTQRYQYGSLTRRKRIRTEDVWQFRYYETSPEGQRDHPKHDERLYACHAGGKARRQQCDRSKCIALLVVALVPSAGANGYRKAGKWLWGVDLNHRPFGL